MLSEKDRYNSLGFANAMPDFGPTQVRSAGELKVGQTYTLYQDKDIKQITIVGGADNKPSFEEIHGTMTVVVKVIGGRLGPISLDYLGLLSQRINGQDMWDTGIWLEDPTKVPTSSDRF